MVRIKGVEVSEVCEIFERINQEGKKLHPVDIIVARTYRSPGGDYRGFYLRDHLRALKDQFREAGTRFDDLDDLTVIQMFAMCLRKEARGQSGIPHGITPAGLNNLTAEDFEKHWPAAERTILDTVKVLRDLGIGGADMLPFVYLILPLSYFLHRNPDADRPLMHQWFWRTSFGLEDFRTSTDVYRYATDFFGAAEAGKPVQIEPLRLSRKRLVSERYYSRRPLTRAVLAFLANQRPLDFTGPWAVVLDHAYLAMSHAPNMHHIYPGAS